MSSRSGSPRGALAAHNRTRQDGPHGAQATPILLLKVEKSIPFNTLCGPLVRMQVCRTHARSFRTDLEIDGVLATAHRGTTRKFPSIRVTPTRSPEGLFR